MGSIEAYLFSLCLIHPEIGDTRFWAALSSEWERLPPDTCRISILWGPLGERNSPRQCLMAGLWHGLADLERPFGNSVWDSWGGLPQPVWRNLCGQLGLSRCLSAKESACQAGDMGLIPGSGRFPGKGNGKPTPVFLSGESHGWRSLVR